MGICETSKKETLKQNNSNNKSLQNNPKNESMKVQNNQVNVVNKPKSVNTPQISEQKYKDMPLWEGILQITNNK